MAVCGGASQTALMANAPLRKRSGMETIMFRRFFINQKLKNKVNMIIFPVMLTFLFAMLGGASFVFQKYDMLLYKNADQILNMTVSRIEYSLSEIEMLSDLIVTSQEVQTSFQLHGPNLRKRVPTYAYNEMAVNCYRLLSEKFTGNAYIDGISVHAGSNCLSVGEFRINEKKLEALGEQAELAKGAVIWVSDDRHLHCVRKIKDIYHASFQNLGTVAISIDMEKLIDTYLYKNPDLLYQPAISIYDDTQSVFSNMDDEIRPIELSGEAGWKIMELNGKKMFVTFARRISKEWIYVLSIPFDSVMNPVMMLRKWILALVLVLLLLSFFLCNRLIQSITKHFDVLINKMRRFAEGERNILPDPLYEKRADEIGFLHRCFEKMESDICALIDDNYVKQLLVNDATIKALRNQLNPHFLFNTLQTVNWMAKANGQKDISHIAESLGALMRYTLEEGSDLVPLYKEIEAVHHYIAIQKYRYQERLQVSIDIPAALETLRIPRLALQNIVENSIKYALEAMLTTCRIRIYCRSELEDVSVVVEDNGPGIDETLLDDMDDSSVVQNTGMKIGLKNIQSRIKLLFSDKYGLVLHNTGHGTIVEMRLPG